MNAKTTMKLYVQSETTMKLYTRHNIKKLYLFYKCHASILCKPF